MCQMQKWRVLAIIDTILVNELNGLGSTQFQRPELNKLKLPVKRLVQPNTDTLWPVIVLSTLWKWQLKSSLAIRKLLYMEKHK